MDYEELAVEFLSNMRSLQTAKKQRSIQEGVQGEAYVLNYIKEKDGVVIPSNISEAMEISSARVAAALNSLENKGMVTREIDTEDRRRIIVKITAKGEERAEEHRKMLIGYIKDTLTALGEDDAREFVRITKKMAEASNVR
ncbi:MAG: MarR family winged helix-turn-helix transcriptional regulator [Methanomassiliicoccaceae archaeon]|nr:MarR family winged helix-turn-helix transcriptional regulator [Methanomassiliicoccaceae archaeon]